MSSERRRGLVEKHHPQLSISRQCAVLGISRGSLYYEPKGESELNLQLMRAIDEQYLKTPWYGARQMARHLKRAGYDLGRKRIRGLMRKMGLRAIIPGPGTSRRNKAHSVYPYLLRDIEVTRPNQAWCADVTYVPLAHGFAYLVAIMDWHTRHVLAWRLSTTQDTDFCLEALEEAIERYGTPEIFNTDQGSPFTSKDWTSALSIADMQISMDGKGQWVDNVFIERLWRSLKYECVYLNAFDSVRDAAHGIGLWLRYYNAERPHSSLGDRTPEEAYLEQAA